MCWCECDVDAARPVYRVCDLYSLVNVSVRLSISAAHLSRSQCVQKQPYGRESPVPLVRKTPSLSSSVYITQRPLLSAVP